MSAGLASGLLVPYPGLQRAWRAHCSSLLSGPSSVLSWASFTPCMLFSKLPHGPGIANTSSLMFSLHSFMQLLRASLLSPVTHFLTSADLIPWRSPPFPYNLWFLCLINQCHVDNADKLSCQHHLTSDHLLPQQLWSLWFLATKPDRGVPLAVISSRELLQGHLHLSCFPLK